MSTLSWDTFETPYGLMIATADESGLKLLKRFNARNAGNVPSGSLRRRPEVFLELRRQLEQYFSGKLKNFVLDINPDGSEFQLSVWRAVQGIPWGSTATYEEIAQQIGKPSALRAVGHANGGNPLHIIIPCHRVIGKDGSLRGYAGGLAMKQRLLELEGYDFGSRQTSLFD